MGKQKEIDELCIDEKVEVQKFLIMLNKAVMHHPERMGVLLQMIFAMNEGRWKDLEELTFVYGSCLNEDNLLGRQIFVNLMNFLRQKELQRIQLKE